MNPVRLLLLTTLFTSISIVISMPISAQENDPDVYYYSQEQSAFVVESANGGNSRTFVNFEVPEYHSVIGPGWSPSGQWFAWTVKAEGSSVISIAHVANRHGELFSLVEPLEGSSTIKMQWSPNDDLLLVVHRHTRYDDPEYSDNINEVFVYDPQLQSRLYTIDLSQYALSISDVEWTPSGKYVVMYENGLQLSDMVIVNLQGQISSQTIYMPGDCLFNTLPYWTIHDLVLFESPDQANLLVHDIGTDTTQSFPLPEQPIRFVDWSRDGQYALLYTSSSCPADSYNLFLLSLPQRTISQLVDNSTFEIPPAIISFRFDQMMGMYNFDSHTSWSDVGTAIVQSTDNILYLVSNLVDSMVSTIDAPLNSSFVGWTNGGDALLLNTGDTLHLQHYDYSNQTLTLEPLVDFALSSFVNDITVSSNGEYIVYVDDKAIFVRQTSLDSEFQREFISTRQPVSIITNAQIFWHPEHQWFFVLGRITNHTGGVINVLNVTGDQREVGECTFSLSCFGWMPQN